MDPEQLLKREIGENVSSSADQKIAFINLASGKLCFSYRSRLLQIILNNYRQLT